MDENEFFREATIAICGNLEIEKALFSCLRVLRKAKEGGQAKNINLLLLFPLRCGPNRRTPTPRQSTQHA
jgi:hypothetical protein